jgi:hypothetical protein
MFHELKPNFFINLDDIRDINFLIGEVRLVYKSSPNSVKIFRVGSTHEYETLTAKEFFKLKQAILENTITLEDEPIKIKDFDDSFHC